MNKKPHNPVSINHLLETGSRQDLIEDYEHRYALRRALLSSYDRAVHRQVSAASSIRFVRWMIAGTILAVAVLLWTTPSSSEVVVTTPTWPAGSFSPAPPPFIHVASSELFEI